MNVRCLVRQAEALLNPVDRADTVVQFSVLFADSVHRHVRQIIVCIWQSQHRKEKIDLCVLHAAEVEGTSHNFRKDYWDGKVVLLDELSCLYQYEDDVRDDCLMAFLELWHHREGHAIQCLIAAGTFSIVHLNLSRNSPFNVANFLQSPYFTIDETRKLFREFAEDLGFSIDSALVEDVWAKSNGLVVQLDWCIPKMV